VLHGQAGQEPRPQAAVPLAEGGEGLFQEVHAGVVDQPAGHDDAGVAERGPGQVVCPAEAAGQASGPVERPPGAGRVPGAVARLSQGQVEGAPPGLVRGRREELDRREGRLVVARRLLVGQPARRAGGRPLGVGRRLGGDGGRAPGRGLAEVVGELRQVLLGRRPVQRLQGLADLAVQADAVGGPQLLVARLAEQGVDEAIAPGHRRRWPARRGRGLRVGGDQDAGGDRLVEGPQEGSALEAGDPGQGRQGGLPARDGRDAEEAVAGRREAVEAAPDDLPHRRGEGQGLLPGPRGPGEPALGGQEPDHLGDVEGVPRRRLVDGGGQPRRDVPSRRHAGERGHLLPAQAGQADPLAGRLPPQLGQEAAQRVPAADLDVPVRAEGEDATLAQPAGEELQEEQRRDVRPVEVVEDDDQGLRGGGGAQEGVDAVEEPEAGLGRGEGRGSRGRGRQAGRDLGHHLGHHPRAGAQLGPQRGRVAPAGVGAQDLHPGPVGGGARSRVAAPPQGPRPARPGPGRRLLRGARLADPRLAGEQDEPALPGAGAGDAGPQRRQLRPAPDERRRRPRRPSVVSRVPHRPPPRDRPRADAAVAPV
jgi:hypothetical protein